MFKNHTEYTDKVYIDLEYRDETFEKCYFYNCTFNACNFDDTCFAKCKFVDCSFKSCSLNLIKLAGTFFIETDFTECKMKGINWTQTQFPTVTLSSPISFNRCDISFSSFYELNLPSISIIESKAHDVDFRGTDLSSSDLTGTDFELSLFSKTNLKNADFRGCMNYRVNPTENIVEKACFNFPEVVNLLSAFNIKIDNIG